MCAPGTQLVTIGRCTSTHFPFIWRGKSAASLSSGGITGPRRSKLMKSSVSAIATRGPPREYAVYVMPHLPNSSSQEIRGSSIPHSSSGCLSGSGSSVGTSSICQLLIPSSLMALVRCEKPRLSSTRASSRTLP